MFLDGEEDDGAMQKPDDGTDMGAGTGMGQGQNGNAGTGEDDADGASDTQAM